MVTELTVGPQEVAVPFAATHDLDLLLSLRYASRLLPEVHSQLVGLLLTQGVAIVVEGAVRHDAGGCCSVVSQLIGLV